MKRVLFSIICISLISAGCTKKVSDKNTQLIQAACDGNLQAVQTLLAEGASVNAKDQKGQTALMWAAYKGYTEIVKILLEKGADINANTGKDSYLTALMIAAMAGHMETTKFLLKKGADINAKTINGETAIKLAETFGCTDIVQLLKKAGAKE